MSRLYAVLANRKLGLVGISNPWFLLGWPLFISDAGKKKRPGAGATTFARLGSWRGFRTDI